MSSTASILKELGQIPMFQNLTKEQKETIAEIAIPLIAARGETITHQGEPSKGFYVLISGSIKIHRVDPEGNERILRIVQPGQTFAEASLFPEGIYPASSRASIQSRLFLIPRIKLVEALRHDPTLALGIIVSLSMRLHTLISSLEKLRGHDIRARLVNWIYSKRPQTKNLTAYTIRIPNTKADLAALLGMRPETLSRHFASLRDEGYIKIQSREITVLNTKAFTQLAGMSAPPAP